MRDQRLLAPAPPLAGAGSPSAGAAAFGSDAADRLRAAATSSLRMFVSIRFCSDRWRSSCWPAAFPFSKAIRESGADIRPNQNPTSSATIRKRMINANSWRRLRGLIAALKSLRGRASKKSGGNRKSGDPGDQQAAVPTQGRASFFQRFPAFR